MLFILMFPSIVYFLNLLNIHIFDNYKLCEILVSHGGIYKVKSPLM
jgi:hypothetical protein